MWTRIIEIKAQIMAVISVTVGGFMSGQAGSGEAGFRPEGTGPGRDITPGTAVGQAGGEENTQEVDTENEEEVIDPNPGFGRGAIDVSIIPDQGLDAVGVPDGEDIEASEDTALGAGLQAPPAARGGARLRHRRLTLGQVCAPAGSKCHRCARALERREQLGQEHLLRTERLKFQDYLDCRLE